jgi:transposase
MLVAGKYDLNSAQLYEAEQHIRGRSRDPGRTAIDNHLFLNAVMFVMRTGKPWAALHPRFGDWRTAYRRFLRYKQAGVWQPLFDELTTARSNAEAIPFDELYLSLADRTPGRPRRANKPRKRAS